MFLYFTTNRFLTHIISYNPSNHNLLGTWYLVDVRFVLFSSKTFLESRVTDLSGISKRTIDYGELVFILVISVTVFSLIINRNKKMTTQ